MSQASLILSSWVVRHGSYCSSHKVIKNEEVCTVSFYHQPQSLYYYSPPYIYRTQQYPPIDESIFIQSVAAFQKITREASTILNRLSNRSFAHQLMTAAQKGNQQEVDRLMKTIRVDSPVATTFTPTGIEIRIRGSAPGSQQCCTLTMNLKWGN